MGKHKKRPQVPSKERADVKFGGEEDVIREQQRRYHQAAQAGAGQRHGRLSKVQISVLLEDGTSLGGLAVIVNAPDKPKCKAVFKAGNKRDLSIDTGGGIQTFNSAAASALRNAINSRLTGLHKEAAMEFPEWLEKHGVSANEANPYFNLDEIREEYKYKKYRFGIWRASAQFGFFDNSIPQFAKFNRIVHLEIQEFENERIR
jgi:hypothetical protein